MILILVLAGFVCVVYLFVVCLWISLWNAILVCHICGTFVCSSVFVFVFWRVGWLVVAG